MPNPITSHNACAACRHQRKKCNKNCLLARYFPPENQTQFLNAHKLYGVGNMLKLIRDLSPSQQDQAMSSIIFESNARAMDPVGGCYKIIQDLHRQIKQQKDELDLAWYQLSVYRSQAQQIQMQEPLHHQPMLHDLLVANNISHPQQEQFDQWAIQDRVGLNTLNIKDGSSSSSTYSSFQVNEQQQKLVGMFDEWQSMGFDPNNGQVQYSNQNVVKENERVVPMNEEETQQYYGTFSRP